MDHSNTDRKPDSARGREEKTPELEGISPLNPSTFPRAEDDEETLAHSPDFHDVPDPGPHAGQKDKNKARS